MKRLLFLLAVFLLLQCQITSAYVAKDNNLDFSVCAPPALMTVKDEMGRISGADFNVPVDQYGRQGTRADGVQQIPFSETEQQNIASDDPANYGQPQTCTTWTVHVFDSPKQDYTVTLKGLQYGVAKVDIFEGIVKSGYTASFDANVFVAPGDVRKVNVAFDPVSGNVVINTVGDPGDLLKDVQTACQLGLITSRKACEFLTLRAKLVERALDKHRDDEAKAALEVFLHALGDSRPSGCRDEDHHLDVKEPALTILKEDAKALRPGR